MTDNKITDEQLLEAALRDSRAVRVELQQARERLAAKDAALEPFRTMLKLAENVARMDNEQIKDDDLFAAINAHGYHAKLTWGDLRALTTPDTGEQSELERLRSSNDELRRENEELRKEARDARKDRNRAIYGARDAKNTMDNMLRDLLAATREAQALRERVDRYEQRALNLWRVYSVEEIGLMPPAVQELWACGSAVADAQPLTTEAEQQEAGACPNCHEGTTEFGHKCKQCDGLGFRDYGDRPFTRIDNCRTCNGTGKAQQGGEG